MIRFVTLRVGLEVHEKVTNQQCIDFAREALEKHKTLVGKDPSVSKMAYLSKVTISVIEDRTMYQEIVC